MRLSPIACVLIALASLVSANPAKYRVIEKEWDREKACYRFYSVRKSGVEVPLKTNTRRSFVSEDQAHYPEPESACGPIALLNLYVWYSKFGLVDESIHFADSDIYMRRKFKEIDRKLLDIQQHTRSEQGGASALAIIVAMDELIQTHGRNGARLHSDIIKPPLSWRDFIKISKNYRAGILSVRPKDPRTGKLRNHHAVLCLRGDRDGVITIANWGTFTHGRLKQKPDGQWFVPRDSSQPELKIDHLLYLLPFIPTPADPSN